MAVGAAQAEWTATLGEDGDSAVLARHRVAGDAIMTVRRPGECNFFTQPGCEVARPNKHFSEKTLAVSRLLCSATTAMHVHGKARSSPGQARAAMLMALVA